MSPQQVHNNTVYLLPLKDDGSPDLGGDYIYLSPPTVPAYCIRFEIDGTSSICREGSLWVNIPDKHEQFDRKRFREFKYAHPHPFQVVPALTIADSSPASTT
jgi:glycogen debranching enzyme